MKLHELSPAPGASREPKRKGRGIGTGNGKTGGRGHKGQKARSGGGVRVGFEGGQMPLARRLPKRGFANIFSKEYTAVNLSAFNVFEDGQTVNAESLLKRGIVRQLRGGLKVLAGGELNKKLTIMASAFSQAAVEKIEQAGGKAEVV